MAINISTETVLTLAEASKILPRRNGKRPSIGTLWRWARWGIKGVRLDYLRFGRTIVTSREALQRFFDALAAVDDTRRGGVTFRELPKRTSHQEQIDRRSAKSILDAAGV
jgi:hypothetical protein